MPFQPDAALRFSHPANRGVVSFLRCQAGRSPLAQPALAAGASPPGPAQPPVAGGYLLHTHPDLCRLLWEACAGLPEPCDSLVYGVATLAARGIIFALAFGPEPDDDWLAVRLAPADADAAYLAGAEPDMGLGDDWLCLNPWRSAAPDPDAAEPLVYWLERAYQNALALPNRPFG
jgi:hypothetical protein